MKKLITILPLFLIFLSVGVIQGQDLIAKWTFPTGNASDSLADGGLPVNLDKGIHTEGGTGIIDFTKNGATTKSAQATGWDNGAMTKCWVIQVNTVGYDNLKLSSKQQSGGNNPGPRDYLVQYRIGSAGEWTEVPNSALIIANDWTTGLLTNTPLPVECNNQTSVYLRWLMTTNTNSTGGSVASNGINKIDDIYINGNVVIGINEYTNNAIFSMAPNPAHGNVTIKSPEKIVSIEIIDANGRLAVRQNLNCSTQWTLNQGTLTKGIYIVRIMNNDGKTSSKQLIIN